MEASSFHSWSSPLLKKDMNGILSLGAKGPRGMGTRRPFRDPNQGPCAQLSEPDTMQL